VVAAVLAGAGAWLFTCERVAALACVAAGNLRTPTIGRAVNGTLDLLVVLALAAAGWLSISTAMLATVGGVAAALVLSLVAVHATGVSLRPARGAPLPPALRLGIPQELAYVLLAAVGRADLLVVVWLRGARDAGLYSVALTIGQLVLYAPMAVAWASYPRLAAEPDESFDSMAAGAFRTGIAVAVACALAVGVAAPVVIGVGFGPRFWAALPAALVLALGGVVASAQWLLARGWTATGEPGLQLRSYATSLAVMFAADLALVPRHGLLGAATGSVAGAAAGLLVCVARYRRADRTIVGARHA
jgi:O-antigen/teichoic acid export membrane protein